MQFTSNLKHSNSSFLERGYGHVISNNLLTKQNLKIFLLYIKKMHIAKHATHVLVTNKHAVTISGHVRP